MIISNIAVITKIKLETVVDKMQNRRHCLIYVCNIYPYL